MEREFKTVMHELKKRLLTVKSTQWLSPDLKRITFTGEDLKDFVSLSADDHVKVFIGESVMRDYTPRRFDQESRELDLEFYMNGKGPAALWAKEAKAGDTLLIGGPKGSRIVPYSFDWYLMIGDETAIPSFSRRLGELSPEAHAIVLIEVEDEKQIIDIEHGPNQKMNWIFRNGETSGESHRIKKALESMTFSEGEYFSWIALEKACAFDLQDYLINHKGTNKEWIKATGYWNKDKKN